jgi:hypothetical protein
VALTRSMHRSRSLVRALDWQLNPPRCRSEGGRQ